MKKLLTSISAGSVAFVPLLALAQFGEINTFFGKISTFINDVLIPLVFGIGLLAFIWGAFYYFIYGGADPEKRKAGTNMMIYSVVGFVLMLSIWGIVNIISTGLFPGSTNETIETPKIPGAQ